MKSVLSIDWESRSAADLKLVGLHCYAVHPSTDIQCLGWAFDNDEPRIWKPKKEFLPPEVKRHIELGGKVQAFNAAFEVQIAKHVAHHRYGFPIISNEQIECTMVRAYAAGLPGSLEKCAAALGVKERKDQAGGRLTLQLAKPKSIDPVTNNVTWWEDEERMERLYAYCLQDVRVEREVANRIPHLSPYERKVWLLDQKINDTGIMVDIPAVKRAIQVVESETIRLNNEMQAISNGQISTCTAVRQIKDYLEFYGVSGETIDKAAVKEHLEYPGLHPTARKILELRAEAGKSSTAKFEAMVNRASQDARLRGCYQYSGANTRRWAGRGVQLQNLPRSKLKFEVVEQIIADLKKGATGEELDLYYGSPLSILGDCVRSFLVAAPKHELLVADFSAIEARVLAWLAGEQNVLRVFMDGGDIYRVAAAQVFGRRPEDVTDSERQIGKVIVLSLGYGGGVSAFQTMAKGYGVKMAPAFEHLYASADSRQKEMAEKNWNQNGSKYEISREEFIASDLTKMFWRANNLNIVRFWYDLENTAITAVNTPGITFRTNLRNVKFSKQGSFLWCQLISGGVICYPYPEIRKTLTPWGEEKFALSYMSEDGTSRKWQRFTTYGGSLAENITQAVSRDLLADAMLRLDEKGFKINLHSHDEVVAEMPIGVAALENVISIMTENPPWAKGLPLSATGFVSKRYRKG